MRKLALWLAIILCFAFSGLSFAEETENMSLFKFSSSESQGDGEASTDAEQASPDEPAAVTWTYPISLEILEDPLDIIQLVNKENLLGKDYPPSDDLHKLEDAKVKKTSSDEKLVRRTAHDALVQMFDAAKGEGLTLMLHSAYRSHYRQSVMYENRLKSVGRDDGVVQKGGASDHQTGLGFDIINPEWAKKSRFNEEFATTAEAQWMAANCARFGFIIRYPQGKTEITGIMYEPWHLRYVGVEVATYMTNSGLTLEEFTEEWQDALAKYEAGEMVAPAPVSSSIVMPTEDQEPVVNSFSF